MPAPARGAFTPPSPGVKAAADPVLDAALPMQLVQALRIQTNGAGGAARVTLQPEYLGHLTIAIQVDGGAVTASIDASSPSVREWVVEHEPLLRQALGEQGLRLARLIVVEDGQSQGSQEERRREEPPPRDQDPPSRREGGGQSTFEIVV
ncbi:MAG: flagellar hook-length control protein FliK [Acidobacteria bacterium]|nr:flagellar hook-length control protein FliK [Acidobacteriota bacterium]